MRTSLLSVGIRSLTFSIRASKVKSLTFKSLSEVVESNGIHLKTRRVIRELIGHMMVEIYDHQCQLTNKKEKKKQEDLAIILSSPCETSSNGIHLKTRRVIRELIGHMMVEIYDHQCQLTKKKKKRNKKT